MKEERVIIEIPITLYNEIRDKFNDSPDAILELAAKKYLEKIQG